MIPLANPGDNAFYTVSFADLNGATIDSAVATVPTPLTQVGNLALDNVADPPTVTIRLQGAEHGVTYQVEIAATLSTGETLSRYFPLMCFAG
jgi:hypothetical protein